MSINTFKVRDGRIRVYKKYVYKYVPFLSGHLVVDGRTQLLHVFRLSLVSQSLTNALRLFVRSALCLSVSLSLSLSFVLFLSLSLGALSCISVLHSRSDATFIPVRFNRAPCSAFITTLSATHHRIQYNCNYNQYTHDISR